MQSLKCQNCGSTNIEVLSASFGVLRAGITLTQQKAPAYNNNLSL